jgi:3-deoxy-D-manno-octulosonic-acid transferase
VNAALRIGYEIAAQIARVTANIAAQVAPRTEAKAVRALWARRGIRDRYRAWGRDHRDEGRPLLWMHAPSVGEGLQARPVLELMRHRCPDVQLAYTHFSPSAETFARSLDVDFRDYLPFDSHGDGQVVLDALRPRALIFAKLDVWPTLTELAHARGVRLGLISATLAPASTRRSRVASALLRDAYGLLDAVGAIDAADGDRLVTLGVRRSVIQVTGDTRYDQVWERALRAPSSAIVSALRASRATIVAGSTWPADEAVLLPAFAAARKRHPDVRLVIAPHEPTPGHLAPIERWAAEQPLRLDRLSSAGPETDVVLVDRVGVLGDLYTLADIAFVGGGFHAAGLHSVVEPAAFGVPVLFGPRFRGSRDAVLLVERRAAHAVGDTTELATRFDTWLGQRDARDEAGVSARELVRSGVGAAERSFQLVQSLLE